MSKLHLRKIGGRTVLFYGSTSIPGFLFGLLPSALVLVLELRTEGLWVYPSWEAAKGVAGSYSDEKLNAFRVERATSHQPDGSVLLGTLLRVIAKAIGKDDLAVTDFGGSCGELGADFLRAFPRATFHVVENETLAKAMRARAPTPIFTTDIPPACDIFYSSGTLQYLDDPIAVLNAGFLSARYAVVLARNSFRDKPLFRVQKTRLFENGGGPLPAGYEDADVTYPHRTISEADVLRVANDHGFECVARIEEQTGVHPYREEVYGKQLIFMRK